MELEQKVLLLALYKHTELPHSEVILMLVESGVFNPKEGKAYLKKLKKEGYILAGELSLVGIEKAKEIEQEFKI